jgi:hypothetical protein
VTALLTIRDKSPESDAFSNVPFTSLSWRMTEIRSLAICLGLALTKALGSLYRNRASFDRV